MFVNYEFIVKRDGNRIRIPSRFTDIMVNSQLLYSFGDPDSIFSKITSAKIGTVKAKRYLTLDFSDFEDLHEVYIIVYQILEPVKINIGRKISGRITSRATFRLPDLLGLLPGDNVKGRIIANLSQDKKFQDRVFETRISLEKTIKLAIDKTEYLPKDRIELLIDSAMQIANNQITQAPLARQLSFLSGIIDGSKIKIVYTFSQISPKIVDLLQNNLTQKTDHPKFQVLEIDSLPYVVFSRRELEKILFWVVVCPSKNTPIYPLLPKIIEFYETSIEPINIGAWNEKYFRVRAKDFSNLVKSNMLVSALEMTAPSFYPRDIVDREKYTVEEASVLSVMISRMLDGLNQTSEHDFIKYSVLSSKSIIGNLVSRGIIAEQRSDDGIPYYTIPRFRMPFISQSLLKEKSQILIIHSFGGGVAKTALSCNLSKYFADKSLKVCLIDLDFINSRLESIFQISSNETKYFNEYLSNLDKPSTIINKTFIDNLDVILADPIGDLNLIKSTDPELNLQYFGQMAKLMNYLKQDYNIIIFDAEGSVDLNIINAFVLSDLAFILSNGNDSSLKGVLNRSDLILKRVGINIRNDYLIQTLVPNTLVELAQKRISNWKNQFEEKGIGVIPIPLIDELKVKEQIYQNNYFVNSDTEFYKWISQLVESIPRLNKWALLN